MVCQDSAYQVWVDLQSCIVAFHSLRNEPFLNQGAGHVVVRIGESRLEPQSRLHATTSSGNNAQNSHRAYTWLLRHLYSDCGSQCIALLLEADMHVARKQAMWWM